MAALMTYPPAWSVTAAHAASARVASLLLRRGRPLVRHDGAVYGTHGRHAYVCIHPRALVSRCFVRFAVAPLSFGLLFSASMCACASMSASYSVSDGVIRPSRHKHQTHLLHDAIGRQEPAELLPRQLATPRGSETQRGKEREARHSERTAVLNLRLPSVARTRHL